MSHEAKSSGAILNTNNNYAAQCKVLPKVATVPLGLESTSVNPYHYGQFLVLAFCRCGDTKIQTIFIHHIGRTTRTCRLWWHRTKFITLAHSCPRQSGLWSTPTEIANRWSCIRYSFINSQTIVENTLYIACFNMCAQQLSLSGY